MQTPFGSFVLPTSLRIVGAPILAGYALNALQHEVVNYACPPRLPKYPKQRPTYICNMYIYIHIEICVCMYIYIQIVYRSIYTYVYVYACMYAYVCVYIYIYM